MQTHHYDVPPKCPKCKKKIFTLRASEKTISYYWFFLGKDLNSKFERDNVEGKGGEIFYCPICDEVLFKDQKKAEAFLRKGVSKK